MWFIFFFHFIQHRGHIYNEHLWSGTSGNIFIDLKIWISIRYIKNTSVDVHAGLCTSLLVYLCYDYFIAQRYLCRELSRGQFSQRHWEWLKGSTKIHRKKWILRTLSNSNWLIMLKGVKISWLKRCFCKSVLACEFWIFKNVVISPALQEGKQRPGAASLKSEAKTRIIFDYP